MDLTKEIRRIAGHESISDYELFSSQKFLKYAKGKMEGLLNGKTQKTRLEFAYAGNETAYTNGNLIHVNTASTIITRTSSQQQRFLKVMGLICHECAHCLYLDFDAKKSANDALAEGHLWPENPETETEEDANALAEIEAEMADPRMRNVFRYVVNNLENVISDYHDEACIKAEYGNFVNICIDALRMSDLFTGAPLEFVLEKNPSNMELFFNLLLQYIYEDDFIVLEEQTKEHPLCQEIASMSGLIDRARYASDVKVTYDCINKLLLRLWPYMREELRTRERQNGSGNQSENGNESQQSGNQDDSGSQQQCPDNASSEGTSGSDAAQQNSTGAADAATEKAEDEASPHSDDVIQELINQLESAVKNAGQEDHIAPQGRSTSRGAQSASTYGADMSSGDAADEEQSADISVLQSILKELKTEKAENEVEKQEAERMNQRAREGLSDSDNSNLNIHRILDMPYEAEETYNMILKDVSQYSRIMQKRIRDILKNSNYDGVSRKHFGRIIRPQEAYRPDGQYFYKKNQPASLPDLCVAIILDCSGSMSGSKLEICRRAGILLEDFCSGLKIPFFMAGHDSQGYNDCDMNIVVPFDRATDKDKYRIMSLYAGGCNRDGLALKTAVNLMATRPEMNKLLFMISDGLPSAYSSAQIAVQDIQEGLKSADRKKIQVISCGIDEDKKQIQEIYGADRFLSIDNLEALPQKLVSIIKRNLLKYA